MWQFDGSLPVYKQITEELRRRIVSGEWPPGTRLPLETELSEEFSVARMTMNKALATLQRQGLIMRRKRLGTVVNTPQSRTAEFRIVTMRRAAQAKGQSYELQPISLTARASTATERDSLGLGEDVLEIKAIHVIDGIPAAFEERLICLSKLPNARDVDLAKQSPEEWLYDALPWAATRIEISPALVDMNVGRYLDVRPGSPCLLIERRLEFEHKVYAFGRLSAVGAASVLTANQVAHF